MNKEKYIGEIIQSLLSDLDEYKPDVMIPTCGIVLFFSKCSGIIVNPDSEDCNKVSHDYASCFDTSVWERLPAGTKLILTQE